MKIDTMKLVWGSQCSLFLPFYSLRVNPGLKIIIEKFRNKHQRSSKQLLLLSIAIVRAHCCSSLTVSDVSMELYVGT